MFEEGLFNVQTFETPKAYIFSIMVFAYVTKQTGNVGDWRVMLIPV